jgi:hypothetical protein
MTPLVRRVRLEADRCGLIPLARALTTGSEGCIPCVRHHAGICQLGIEVPERKEAALIQMRRSLA